MKVETIAILGAGSWGTALAALWGADANVLLWGRNSSLVDQLKTRRENRDYLPGLKLPETVRVTTELKDCARSSLIVFVMPSTALRGIANDLQNAAVNHDSKLLSCAKGIEHGTGMRMSQILQEIFPHNAVAVLSGPNLASEVAQRLPTATVIGAHQNEVAQQLQGALGTPRFRIYTSDEVAGIELGGSLKNIFAIAAGVSDGLGLGDNSKAALITRALAELVRLGTAMGGQLHTFYGLSGVGDLIVTCCSARSRNRTVGYRLGQGESLDQITASLKMVAEGIPTTRSAFECARKFNVDTPIIDQVYALLYQGKTPTRALEELLQRDQKAERF